MSSDNELNFFFLLTALCTNINTTATRTYLFHPSIETVASSFNHHIQRSNHPSQLQHHSTSRSILSQPWQTSAMAPSRTNSQSTSSNRNGEVVGPQANVLASCYIVDTTMNLTGFHYSTTGAGGTFLSPFHCINQFLAAG
jgi:hypothetical protein